MREILFRGKRTDNGEWTKGTPFFAANCCKMIHAVAVHPDFADEGNVYYSEGYPVDPETVGQFTGLTDKNGVKIFEGDIMEYVNDDGTKAHYVVCVDGEIGAWVTSLIGFVANVPLGYAIKIFEVIGNRFDNPELLEVNT